MCGYPQCGNGFMHQGTYQSCRQGIGDGMRLHRLGHSDRTFTLLHGCLYLLGGCSNKLWFSNKRKIRESVNPKIQETEYITKILRILELNSRMQESKRIEKNSRKRIQENARESKNPRSVTSEHQRVRALRQRIRMSATRNVSRIIWATLCQTNTASESQITSEWKFQIIKTSSHPHRRSGI